MPGVLAGFLELDENADELPHRLVD